MLPEETGLRRELAHRTFRSPEEIWPVLRRKLDTEEPRRPAAALSALASAVVAVMLLIVLIGILRGRSERVVHRLPPEGFAVTNVRSLGRPATSIVLRPDSRTLMVVVD
jgi:hypothetical protein